MNFIAGRCRVFYRKRSHRLLYETKPALIRAVIDEVRDCRRRYSHTNTSTAITATADVTRAPVKTVATEKSGLSECV